MYYDGPGEASFVISFTEPTLYLGKMLYKIAGTKCPSLGDTGRKGTSVYLGWNSIIGLAVVLHHVVYFLR